MTSASVSAAFKAQCTPEFFLYDSDGALVYHVDLKHVAGALWPTVVGWLKNLDSENFKFTANVFETQLGCASFGNDGYVQIFANVPTVESEKFPQQSLNPISLHGPTDLATDSQSESGGAILSGYD